MFAFGYNRPCLKDRANKTRRLKGIIASSHISRRKPSYTSQQWKLEDFHRTLELKESFPTSSNLQPNFLLVLGGANASFQK